MAWSAEPVSAAAPRLSLSERTSLAACTAGAAVNLLCPGQASPPPTFRCLSSRHTGGWEVRLPVSEAAVLRSSVSRSVSDK